MTNALVTNLAAGIGLLLACSAGATTITFEDNNFANYDYYPSGTNTGFSYYEYGVNISPYSMDGSTYVSGATSPNGTRGIYAYLRAGRTGALLPLRASLPQPTDYVSVDLGDFGVDAEEIYLDAYDRRGTLLGESRLAISDTDTSMHTLSLLIPGIAYAVFGSTDRLFYGGGIYADNFTFNDSSVPEPASWMMVIAGFGAISAAMRRQKVAVAFD